MLCFIYSIFSILPYLSFLNLEEGCTFNFLFGKTNKSLKLYYFAYDYITQMHCNYFCLLFNAFSSFKTIKMVIVLGFPVKSNMSYLRHRKVVKIHFIGEGCISGFKFLFSGKCHIKNSVEGIWHKGGDEKDLIKSIVHYGKPTSINEFR